MELVGSIRGEMQQRVKDGFSILTPTADAVRIFGESLKISRIAAVPQSHFRPRPILKLLVTLDKGILGVNDNTGR